MFPQSDEALLFFSPPGKRPGLFYILSLILSSYQGLGKMWEEKAAVLTDFPLIQCSSNSTSLSPPKEPFQTFFS